MQLICHTSSPSHIVSNLQLILSYIKSYYKIVSNVQLILPYIKSPVSWPFSMEGKWDKRGGERRGKGDEMSLHLSLRSVIHQWSEERTGSVKMPSSFLPFSLLPDRVSHSGFKRRFSLSIILPSRSENLFARPFPL